MNGRRMFLNVVSENQVIVQHVQLFRMPLFLTMLDEEFGKYDDTAWENENTVGEIARKVMPMTLSQFGIPIGETESVIVQCLDVFAKKKGV